ncbi:MAG: exodeoxyribonuclease V subunit gamma [Thermoleophilaceae bacterium]|nr:exodeoxyribonuclease V subunit gamma [Thermoleophilaceae bacterium]
MLDVHRAERGDGLLDALRLLLLEPLPDPFAREVIAVHTRGMERWLTQRMSAHLGATPGGSDGVCANVEFPSPRRVVGYAVAAASGIEPETDPWLPERAVWPLLEVDEALAEPWLASLAAHLDGTADEPGPARRARRFTSVRHLADLFDRYALHRPEMVRAWARGNDTDGAGRNLPPDTSWQATLWRRLHDRIADPGPAERLEDACARLREDPSLVDLPPRVSLFGLTRLPAGHLAVLRALAAGRDVHLFLLHPSPALWERVAHATERRPPITRRSKDATATLPANRFLASWGHDARELQLVLASVEEHVDHHHPVESDADTLLARIQADVRGDRSPPGAPLPGHDDARPALDPTDRSVQVHACHGRARQVEVLRDEILHVLEDDPSLEPRDVIVMCPDIETFAPLIQATFGAGEVSSDGDDEELDSLLAGVRPPDLRVRLADRSVRQTNPVLGVVARLIELAEERLTASQVLDLADREPVRRRFHFDDDDLARMEEWVAASGIRWGLDAEHREPFKLGALAANTWRAGLDRVLVGVTMTEGEPRLFEGVLPLDDVDSGAIELAGRFAELVDRLRTALDALNEPKTIDAWAAAIAGAADGLAATTERDAWQSSELQRLLDDVVAEATVDGTVHPSPLALPEVRALLAERLQGRPTRANFRTGHLTICTLMPMRSVPHRVVCLLGLDDGAFPRSAPRDGDDLMLADPHVGDRDARTEDRQLLLDALLAATDRLVITYTGNDERTNAPQPPAVPVGELLDMVDRTVRTDDRDARERVVVRHPLQPFDPKHFTAGELLPERAWSFDRVMLAGARALNGERTEPGPFLAAPLPGAAAALVEVEDLVRFLQHPVRAFLRQRLGISVRDFSDEVDDALPVELDGLEQWDIGQRLLEVRLAGTDLDTAFAAELARGTLPPGKLAGPVIDRVRPIVEGIAGHSEALLDATAQPGSVDVKVALSDGRTVSGTVPGVCGDLLHTATYSRVSAKHRLAMWVRWLALTAAYPERAFAAGVVGRARQGAKKGTEVTIVRLPALAPDAGPRLELAVERLAALVDLYDRGMREPLPLACLSSAAYAHARKPEAAGRKAWETEYDFDKEDKDLEHQLVLGGVRTFAELLEESPRPDEAGEGWDATETTRFGRYARRLWTPVLAHEEVSDH